MLLDKVMILSDDLSLLLLSHSCIGLILLSCVLQVGEIPFSCIDTTIPFTAIGLYCLESL